MLKRILFSLLWTTVMFYCIAIPSAFIEGCATFQLALPVTSSQSHITSLASAWFKLKPFHSEIAKLLCVLVLLLGMFGKLPCTEVKNKEKEDD